MEYIRADISNAKSVSALAALLYNEDASDALLVDITHAIENEDGAVFLCTDSGTDVGFAEFSLRNDYVEGTHRRPVGYVEAVYVKEPYRKKGIARKLIGMGEAWAKGKGCRQMASDCELANAESLHFHLRCGFAEANRIICFVRDI